MTPIQNKICSITNQYIKENYEEYCSVCDSLKDMKQVQKDEFASTGSDGYLKQLATVVPKTLDDIIQAELDEDEWKYYKSNTGTLWFAKTYPEFSVIQKHG